MNSKPQQILRVATRGSELALAQAHSVVQRGFGLLPDFHIQYVVVETTGDKNQNTPLYGMGERDVFSKSVNAAILDGRADIAVHSLKDLSLEEEHNPLLFSKIVERELPHDILLISKNGLQQFEKTAHLLVGTSSLRRKEQVPQFLPDSIPGNNTTPKHINSVPIRGNVLTRLQKLHAGEVHALVIALAGLNRLLDYEPSRTTTQKLLEGLFWQILPLIECTPAPGQGALCVQCLQSNNTLVQILHQIPDFSGSYGVQRERQTLAEFGGGCLQQFGAVFIGSESEGMLCVSGRKNNGMPLLEHRLSKKTEEQLHDILKTTALCFVSKHSADLWTRTPIPIQPEELKGFENIFISSAKCLHDDITPEVLEVLAQKRVWAAGSTTLKKLCLKGIWCYGSADGFGFTNLVSLIRSSFVRNVSGDSPLSSILILTHLNAVLRWQEEGFQAIASYSLGIKFPIKADFFQGFGAFFWTSPEQYELLSGVVPDAAVHICPSGRTARYLQIKGLQPIIVPTISSMEAWHQQQTFQQ